MRKIGAALWSENPAGFRCDVCCPEIEPSWQVSWAQCWRTINDPEFGVTFAPCGVQSGGFMGRCLDLYHISCDPGPDAECGTEDDGAPISVLMGTNSNGDCPVDPQYVGCNPMCPPPITVIPQEPCD